MDGDGQNDPADIPKMIGVLKNKNLDLVCGWRKDRKDPNSIKVGAKIAAKLRKLFLKDDTIDSGCTLKVFRKRVAKRLNLFKGMHRFIPALLKTQGFKTVDMKVNHRPRTSGKTKYNWLKYFPGILGMLTVLKIRLDSKNKGYFFNLLWFIFFIFYLLIFLVFSLPLLLNISFVLFLLGLALILFLVRSETRKFYNYKPNYKIEEIKHL
jgi:hypothetical protein